MLREWIPLQHNYLRSLYAHYTPPPLNAEGSYMCAGCNNGGGVWKCMSCIGYPIFCPTCCLAEHRRTPFHRVEQWNVGGYWEPAWLRQVGVSINLGHRGGECSQPAAVLDDDEDGEANRPANAAGDDEAEIPADPLHHADSPPRPPPAMMTIVDTSGVHFLPVTPCGCPWAGDHTSQLLDAGLYPASQRKARTCFTFAVLDAFLLDNLECKTTAMNFYQRIRRATNPAFPHEVPVSQLPERLLAQMITIAQDRYLELLRVSREWALLQAKKQFGYGPQWRGAPGNGDLAHFCPACPQPGVNIPADWEVDDRKYLYARGYVMDGNFHAEQMKMRKPENDEHLKVAKDVKMHSSCNDHKAVSQANADRHKLAVTGIGATSCLRHGCFLPHSVVNYQKGERQMNMDYSLSNALGYRSRGIGHVYLSYDIMCQYHVHLDDRFDQNPHLEMPGGLVLYKCIGLFHIHGHKAECELRHSLTFTEGAGQADGEIIETQWSGINPVSGSTRTMSTSHRQETLDRHMNNWNWKKMITMVASLRRKIKANRPLLAEMKADLTAKEASVDAEVLGAWRRELRIVQRKRLRDVKVMDRYQAKKQISGAIPARASNKAGGRGGRGRGSVGTADWIADGLKLEEQQLGIQKDVKKMGAIVTRPQELKLAKRRKTLEIQIRRFHRRAAAIHRRHNWGIAEQDAVEDDSGDEWEEDRNDDSPWRLFSSLPPAPYPSKASEHTKLGLPSNLSRNALAANGLQRLAAHELTLRRGQANDALQQLRILIGKKSFEFQTTIRHGRREGHTKRTRSFTKLGKLDRAVQLQAAIYRRARAAMQVLGVSGEEQAKYKPLTTDDLNTVTAIAEPNKPGQRHKSSSWIWNVDVGGDMRSDDELGIIHRVQWFHARSKVDRLEEEAAILRRELDSVCRYFANEASRWRQLATRNTEAEYPGFSQHCRAQAALFDRLHQDAMVAWRDLYIEPNVMT
ncbi:uncharacterized protein B0H18DRAFT_1124455 [Fomitopsis serialis]|uniref:uncharacterized protein n=1 Tax=Fomitopsis serialis TaxID=139415 RepID=UPI00200720FB|nr:uncharacterized protein B0H18DRAFT_1124455 [Neoantrodia serialis]KAH9916158.1 hypothetical protein B0H18DRAFT_1124455 [Neoantrodia serialis]